MKRSGLLERLSRGLDLRVVVPGNPGRIGHLALDFDSYIKERLLQRRTRRPLYLIDFRAPANTCLLDYWRRYIRVIERRPAWRLRHLANVPALVDDLSISYASVLNGASPCYAIESDWGDRPPLLKLDADHAARGEATLRQMGVPEGAWFVCVHARGGGYSPSDEHIQSYRNASIGGYVTAMQEIVARGGWCIRMGDPSMESLPPMPNTVDYALSQFKSDWMDVFLCARARFFLGNNSGIYLVSSVFGVPTALTNMAPMGAVYSIFRHDISIPKITLDRGGRPMSFPALFSSPLADARYTEEFEQAGVTLLPSAPEDIVDLTREMLARLDGTYTSTLEDERRQDAFRALLRPHHYSWGARARIGDAFLRRYEHLLRQ
jgi:putative glycosyltransferase (TIGR04372 family)